MKEPSLLESAADLREKTRTVRAAIDEFREIEGVDWMSYQLLADEIERGADAVIRSAWLSLDRVERLVRQAREERMPDAAD